MKNTNKILSGILAASIMFGTTSCGDDFLKENANHTTTDALLETGAGALAMAAGLYGNLRWHFGYEWAYAITLVNIMLTFRRRRSCMARIVTRKR